MKIHTRLALAALLTVFPIWIGLAIITVEARQSDSEKTSSLIEEYMSGIAVSISAFLGRSPPPLKALRRHKPRCFRARAAFWPQA